MTINDFSIENMRDELSRASIKAGEDAKTIAILKGLVSAARCPTCDGGGAYHDNSGEACQCQWCYESKLLTNNKPNIDFPLLLQDEAG